MPYLGGLPRLLGPWHVPVLNPRSTLMSRKPTSRRQFLQSAGAAVAVVHFTPYIWSAEKPRIEAPGNRLGVGSIGVGGRGSGVGHDAGGEAT